MSFFDWIRCSMFVDLLCVVLIPFLMWKVRKVTKNNSLLREDLDVVMKNPAAARRRLKERQ